MVDSSQRRSSKSRDTKTRKKYKKSGRNKFRYCALV